jgi:hypothetical protein
MSRVLTILGHCGHVIVAYGYTLVNGVKNVWIMNPEPDFSPASSPPSAGSGEIVAPLPPAHPLHAHRWPNLPV